MKLKRLLLMLMPLCTTAYAQNIIQPDSAKTLENIVVKAYENNSRLIDVPAAISLVSKTDLNRFNNTSILPALNNNPGVRMEERSPGSYRLSIRGSSLRAPFGVRNVKVYYDGIPYTDPGGNTYLNQLGFYNIQSVEIIKGPAGSLYGAGTGGVLLLRNDLSQFHPGASVTYNTGSYNLNNVNASVRFGTDASNNTISYQHQTSDGYRDHTNLRRDVLTWDAIKKNGDKSILEAHFLYGDLYYQTPGALTLKEYDSIPKSARPAAGGFPSASVSQAAFFQKTFLAGVTLEQKISDEWKNTTAVYGAYSQTSNPSFRNYGKTTEPHFGGRTVFEWNKKVNTALLTFHAGAEFQQSFNTQRIYNNNKGQTDSLQTDDEIYNKQGFLFIEANAQLEHGWIITAGASINRYGLNFTRRSNVPPLTDTRNFNDEFTPRFALLKEVTKNISLYGSIARGFSPPTINEVLPSTNVFNTQLQAESGFDYEFGLRGTLLRSKLYFDINAFFYKLQNAIVQRRDSSGADYFDNAGSAKENGLETFLTYELINKPQSFITYSAVHLSDTWNNFHYGDFKQITSDYSGNKLPGVAPQTVAASLDVTTKPGIYLNINYFYSAKIALNDANSQYASTYNLLSARLGIKTYAARKIQIEFFAGADNILNEKYSLGNDINAAGSRYYNLAPGVNYYAGVSFNFISK